MICLHLKIMLYHVNSVIKGISKQFPEEIIHTLFIKVSEDGKESYINIPIKQYLDQSPSELFKHSSTTYPETALQQFIVVVDYSTYAVNSLLAVTWNIAHSYLDYPVHKVETTLENIEDYLYDVYNNFKDKHEIEQETSNMDVCPMQEEFQPINKKSEESINQDPVEIIPKQNDKDNQESKHQREIIYREIQNGISIADIFMHRNELSSQFDRAIIGNILNITTQHISDVNISFVMDGIGSLIQNKHLSNEQIRILMISHLSILMKDIPSDFCHLQLMSSHDGNKFMFELIFSMIKMEIPILGEIKMVYELLNMFIHLFDKHYIDHLNIQGRKIPVSMTQSIHNFHHVYKAEIHDDLFEIDVASQEHRHSNTAKKQASADYMQQMKENAFYTSGIPFELMFPENDFNHPHGMYETYKNMRLCDRFLHAYINFNNLTPEEAYFYMAYMNMALLWAQIVGGIYIKTKTQYHLL